MQMAMKSGIPMQVSNRSCPISQSDKFLHARKYPQRIFDHCLWNETGIVQCQIFFPKRLWCQFNVVGTHRWQRDTGGTWCWKNCRPWHGFLSLYKLLSKMKQLSAWCGIVLIQWQKRHCWIGNCAHLEAHPGDKGELESLLERSLSRKRFLP